jgi:hypothetical protein
MTVQDVRLQLITEETAQTALGNVPKHKVSPTSFFMTGFELEDAQ